MGRMRVKPTPLMEGLSVGPGVEDIVGRWVTGAVTGGWWKPQPLSCPYRHGFDPSERPGCQVRAGGNVGVRGHRAASMSGGQIVPEAGSEPREL